MSQLNGSTVPTLRFDNPNDRQDARVVVVTGAGSGIGKAHALEFARRGAKVVVNDFGTAIDGSGSSATPAQLVVDEIVASGGIAVADHNSVTTWEGGQAIIQTAIDVFGQVNVVVNNAGNLRDKMFHEMNQAMIDSVIDVHLKGAFNVTQPAFRLMREQGYGRIVFTTSASGLFGNIGQANYGAAKMALVGLVKVLSLEGAKFNIMVNAIAPIAVTRMTANKFDLGFAAPPESATAMAVFLGHEQCHETGSIYSVAGCRISKIRFVETFGFVFPKDGVTADAVGANIPQISNSVDGCVEPGSLGDEIDMMKFFIKRESSDESVHELVLS